MTKRSPNTLTGSADTISGSHRTMSSPETSETSRIKALEAEVALYRHALEKSRQEMQAFAYSVSHDLRAPVRAIEGFSRIIIEDCAPSLSEEGRKYLQHVIANTQQLSSQIEDLLRFYRIGKSAPQRATLDAAEIAREALGDLAWPGTAKVEIRITDPAYADPVQLRQIFAQLISNALKFSQSNVNPLIELTSSRDEHSTHFSIKDNGVGFDPKHVGKLFQVFQKLHSNTEFPGNGIGLAIVKRIVEAHGGCVRADAQPDHGATFTFSLPTS